MQTRPHELILSGSDRENANTNTLKYILDQTIQTFQTTLHFHIIAAI